MSQENIRSGLFITLALVALASPTFAREPSGAEQLTAVAAVMPTEFGEIAISASTDWYPNIMGYNDMRSGFFFSGAAMGIRVYAAITPSAVILVGWDDGAKRYNIMKLIKVSDLRQVSTDKYLLGTRLVLQSSDYSYNSFNFLDGDLIDSAKAKEASAYLLQRLASANTQETTPLPSKQP